MMGFSPHMIYEYPYNAVFKFVVCPALFIWSLDAFILPAMVSLLRQIVAGPRARHPEAGLDLCYVADNIIATSGPSQTYPQRAYRNPLDRLVKFLDAEHGENWAIWEFRAEGTGYPDELVYNRINHYPWPDHHPPPFHLVPMIIASMRNWLGGSEQKKTSELSEEESKLAMKVLNAMKGKKNERVAVVHCKAGKGRSGTVACSYLIAECGWTVEQATARFTERRMKPNWGPGVSIPSQLRYLGYVDRWTKGGNKYVDREVEIVEIHVWGLRHGVKLAVEGYVDQGKKIKVFHTFTRKERKIVEGNAPGGSSMIDMMFELAGNGSNSTAKEQSEKTSTNGTTTSSSRTDSTLSAVSEKTPTEKAPTPISQTGPTQTGSSESSSTSPSSDSTELEPGGMAVIFKPETPIRIPNSDVNITIERRHRVPKSVSLGMVTAVAHVWFNTFFEGNGPEQDGVPNDSGIFEIEWDKLDGIKGSGQKGIRAADRIAVVWRSIGRQTVTDLPSPDVPVPQMRAADWKGEKDEDPDKGIHLGLLSVESGESSDSVDEGKEKEKEVDDDFAGLRSDGMDDEQKDEICVERDDRESHSLEANGEKPEGSEK